MERRKPVDAVVATADELESQDFDNLLQGNVSGPVGTHARIQGVVVGTLVGFTDNGMTPLVTFRGQAGVAAIPARATVDLHGPHIGRDAVLMFEEGDVNRPIIVGCIRSHGSTSAPQLPGRVEVGADGERLVVSANHGLVLRCGQASITLSRDGKIVVRGTQVVSHATGLNRIKGGSVQVN